MNLLIPIDGSIHAERALAYAIRRLQQSREPIKLHVLNVQTPIVTVNVKLFVSVESLQAHYREAGQEALASALALAKSAGVEVAPHIGVGDPSTVILEYATSLSADEIVMGRHGRGVLADSLIGSVAQKIAHRATMPVVLVH